MVDNSKQTLTYQCLLCVMSCNAFCHITLESWPIGCCNGELLRESLRISVGSLCEWSSLFLFFSSGRYNPVSIPVGGSVAFNWQGQHSVYEVLSYACPAAYNPPAAVLVGAVASGGSSVVNFTSSGVRYFACSVGNHCSRGELRIHPLIIVSSLVSEECSRSGLVLFLSCCIDTKPIPMQGCTTH